MINKEILIEYIEMLKDSCKGEEGDDQDPFLFGRRMGSISALVKLKIALEVNDYDVSIVGLDFDIEKKYL